MIAREMAGNTTLKTLDISEEVLNGVRSDTYPITLTNLIGKMGPAVDTLMLSRQQVARLGFEGILKALALRPNIVNLSPSPGQSWLPREESMCFMDPATKDAIHLTLLQLQAFENPASDDMAGSISAAGSISFVSLRDLLLERMKGYHLIYRAVCENIVLKVLSPHERALFYNKVWELYGKPMGNMKFGEEHAFKSWFVFFRAVEESKLHHRFPFLF